MSECIDCPPCEDIYTDSQCASTTRLKCIVGGITIEFIDVLPSDTGVEIITKLSDALKIVNDKIVGATGEFESADGKIITVVDGLITSIV